MDRLVPWVLFGLLLPGCGFGGEDGEANESSTVADGAATGDDDDDSPGDDDDDSPGDDDDDSPDDDDDDDDDGPGDDDDDDDDGEMGCCVRHESAGCNEPEVEACVCEVDAACCTFEWDDNCVDAARNDCDATCEAVDDDGADDLPGTDDMGDATDEGTDGTDGPSATDDMGDVMDDGGPNDVCCEASAQPGCDDAELEACVCGNDPFCCDMEWDFQCTLGADECGAGCSGAGGTGCCVPHATTGCDDMMVESCVCDLDPFCCNQAWDEQCVGEAAMQCMAGC